MLRLIMKINNEMRKNTLSKDKKEHLTVSQDDHIIKQDNYDDDDDLNDDDLNDDDLNDNTSDRKDNSTDDVKKKPDMHFSDNNEESQDHSEKQIINSKLAYKQYS